jgi:hypothetical protein
LEGRSRLRHTRQIRLPEIGDCGQALFAAGRVRVVGEGLAAEVAARYLAGAGVGTLCVDGERVARAARAVDPDVKTEPAREAGAARAGPPFELVDGAAREVAAGAWAALVALRRLLAKETA